MSRYGRRQDGNHAAIVEALKWSGNWFWDASQGDLGVDGLIVGHGRIVPVECKVPSPTGRYTLTPREREVHEILAAHGVKVEILTDVQSLEVLGIGRPARNYYGKV